MSPKGRQAVGLRQIGRVLAVAASVLMAAALGFGGTLAAAVVTPRPALLLATGAITAALAAGAGCGVALRRLPARTRAAVVAVFVVALVVVGGVAVLTPLRDPRDQAPVPDVAFWSLETGSRLAYVPIRGQGSQRATPVVVLHGGPGVPDIAGDAAYFGQLSELGYDVYVYDELGSGRSTRLADPTGYGVGRDVADLEAVRRAISADRMVLVGHSFGGALAAHYLAAHPDRVEKLVLSSPEPLDPADTSADRATVRLGTGPRLRVYAAALAPRALLGYLLTKVDIRAAHAFLPDAEADARNDTILTLAEPALHCTPTQAHGPVRGSGFYRLQYPQSPGAPGPADPRPALVGLPTPTLLVKGSCDYLSWRSALDYRHALEHTSLVYLPGAGHNTYQDRPADVLADITAFLADTPLPVPALTDAAAEHLQSTEGEMP